MTKAEILKKEILRQYRSVRQFAMEMNIPYSTLVTALERGIEGMAYGTVIKMCDKLSLNPVDFSSLERDASLGAQLLENRVMQNYVKLNQTGRDKILYRLISTRPNPKRQNKKTEAENEITATVDSPEGNQQ